MIRIEERKKLANGAYKITGSSLLAGDAAWAVLQRDVAEHPHRYGPHGTHRLVILDLSGEPFNPGAGPMPGYVVGRCGHRVAESEWCAGYRTCERCLGGSS